MSAAVPMTRLVLLIETDLAVDLEDLAYHRRESRSSMARSALRGHVKRLISQMKDTSAVSSRLIAKYSGE